MRRMASANQQQLCLQRVHVVDHRRVWSAGRNQRYVTLAGCCRRHTFRCLSDPNSFDMCRSDPVLSRNGSVMTTDVGEDGNREFGLSAS